MTMGPARPEKKRMTVLARPAALFPADRDTIAVDVKMIDELERIWKEVVVA
jgi:hypothetical protein